VRRRLFNLAAALSLALCVAIAGLWMSSFFWGEDFYYRHVTTNPTKMFEYHIRTTRGWSVLLIEDANPPVDPFKSPLDIQRIRSTAGFWHQRFEGSPDVRSMHGKQFLEVPIAAFVPPVAVPPLVWLTRKHRERKRRRAGACPSCGYDLRASRDRCPECGASNPAAI
jgi:hypothetical protein